MSRRYNYQERNNLQYPIELPWYSRIYTLKIGDTLEYQGKYYRVTIVNRSVVPGEQPTIEVEPVDATCELCPGVGSASPDERPSKFR
jgi:hypothetical protein